MNAARRLSNSRWTRVAPGDLVGTGESRVGRLGEARVVLGVTAEHLVQAPPPASSRSRANVRSVSSIW